MIINFAIRSKFGAPFKSKPVITSDQFDNKLYAKHTEHRLSWAWVEFIIIVENFYNG